MKTFHFFPVCLALYTKLKFKDRDLLTIFQPGLSCFLISSYESFLSPIDN